MDQIKIGKFISQKRKEQKMTQMQLAEKLGITDRAVSKWETGKSMPDASIMLELCGLLKITVNELLSGEALSMNDYNETMERNLIEMVREKEQSDKRLLAMEIVIGVVSAVFMLTLIGIGVALKETGAQMWVFWLLVAAGLVQFLICTMFAIRIEQVAGYYECQKCGHKHIPSFGAVFIAMHMGRTRYMKCPECGKRSWQKKVISKERTE